MGFEHKIKGSLDKLLGKEVKPPVKAKAQVKKAVPIKSSLQAKPAVSKKAPVIIGRKDDIPSHDALLSAPGGLIPLSKDLQARYAILLLSRESKDVVIIASSETINSLDDDYLSISDQVKRQGYTKKRKVYAKPEIIGIIYEQSNESLSLEVRKHQSTKIQLDFDELLKNALYQEVSDIHIEVRREDAKVRFRKHGDLFDYAEWAVHYARTMATVIYQVIADEKDTTFDEAKAQDALIDRDLAITVGDNIENQRIRVRLATIPAYPSGFDMIMRVLKMGQDGNQKSLDTLGYEPTHLSHIRRAVAKPTGAIIMAGTTGSGKSTSLNSMLSEKISHYGGRIKVISVEDPPEYLLRKATQVPVVRSRAKAKSGGESGEHFNPFASIVRGAMRADPDLLAVGEVRDESSAELLIHAVQSGHQVFSTVHASSSLDIVPRLRSNGIGDDVLAGQNFLSALLYQTLLPTLCPHCSHTVFDAMDGMASPQELEVLERIHRYIDKTALKFLRFKNDKGCEHCEGKGIVGRSVAAEVILPDPYMRSCFRQRNDDEALMHYRRKGGKIALEHGLMKALRGQVDIREVESKLDQITYLEELDFAVRKANDNEKPKIFVVGTDIFSSEVEEQGPSDEPGFLKEIRKSGLEVFDK